MVKSYQIQKCKLVREKTIKYECEPITSPADAMRVIEKHLSDEPEEHVIALAMNINGEIIALHEISHGDITSASVTPGNILKRILLNNAAAFIMAHNHPSGNCEPSSEDDDVTRRVNEAAQIVGVKMLDHIIIGNGKNYSYKSNGLI